MKLKRYGNTRRCRRSVTQNFSNAPGPRFVGGGVHAREQNFGVKSQDEAGPVMF